MGVFEKAEAFIIWSAKKLRGVKADDATARIFYKLISAVKTARRHALIFCFLKKTYGALKKQRSPVDNPSDRASLLSTKTKQLLLPDQCDIASFNDGFAIVANGFKPVHVNG